MRERASGEKDEEMYKIISIKEKMGFINIE